MWKLRVARGHSLLPAVVRAHWKPRNPKRRRHKWSNPLQLSPSHQRQSHRQSPRRSRERNSRKATGRKTLQLDYVTRWERALATSAVIEASSPEKPIHLWQAVRVQRVVLNALPKPLAKGPEREKVRDRGDAITSMPDARGTSRWLVRSVGVPRGRDFARAALRTVIVPRAGAGVGDASAYFFVVGQIKRHG